MADIPSIRFRFDVPYRGGTHEWSVRFHFQPDTPASTAEWDNLEDAIWLSIRAGMLDSVSYVEAIGYTSDTAPSVYHKTRSGSNGTVPTSGDIQSAYVAALLSWPTDARDSRSHPIYCRNFIHGVKLASASAGAAIDTTQRTALTTFAHDFSDAGGGFTADGKVYKRSTPRGAVGLDGSCEQYPSHRVLARRG